MIASASLTLAVIQWLVWYQSRTSRDRLAFFFMGLATASMAIFELRIMLAQNPAEYAEWQRWFHIPIFVNFVSIICFVLLNLKAGRKWLGLLAIALRAVSLLLNFFAELNINYLEISSLRSVSFLGDLISIPVGTPNPQMLIAQCGLLVLILFLLDASISVWKRGNRVRAVFVGGSLTAWVIMGTVHAILAYWLNSDIPVAASLYFMGLLLIMAFDLSIDTIRAGKLAVELQETQEAKRRELTHLARVATLGELSGSIAHELNQPLGSILSNAQAAQRMLEKDLPNLPEIQEILTDIISEDRRAGDVIKRLRALLQRGETSLQATSVNACLTEVLRLMHFDLISRGVTVRCELATDPPLILSDGIQLQQIFLNLIVNACDAMENNQANERHLTITTKMDDANVHVVVCDNGKGLPADIEPIFQAFHTTKENGLGMGLAICRTIASAHQGQLWAERNTDRGSTFHLTLPINRADS